MIQEDFADDLMRMRDDEFGGEDRSDMSDEAANEMDEDDQFD